MSALEFAKRGNGTPIKLESRRMIGEFYRSIFVSSERGPKKIKRGLPFLKDSQ